MKDDRPCTLCLLVVIFLFVVTTMTLVLMWSAEIGTWEKPPTDFDCRPGETMTLKECP